MDRLRFVLSKKQTVLFYTWVLISHASLAAADDAAEDRPTATLKEVVVTARKERQATLPDVQGAKLYAGKKTSVVDLGDAPPAVNSNYRQALQTTPGLVLSEETTPLFSLGYRGLNPDRAQFMQVLKDGVPIQADLFGYPEAYYTPPLEVVDNIEFVRGGSALMYGPEPGGAINFVTQDPYEGPFSFLTQNSMGSHDFYSHTTALGGTQGILGHYDYFHHRQSQGFREFNSQFEVYYGGVKVVVKPDPTAKWTVAFDLYEETHGEPGGLTRTDFDVDLSKSTRLSDHFELNRYYGTLAYEKEISEALFLDWKLFGGDYERLSWRQRGGGFGTIPTGANASTNDIQRQEFYTAGTDLRLRRRYEAFGSADHVLSAGMFYYHSDSPREEKRGTTGDALDGAIRKDSDRQMNYFSLFAENVFKFGALSVTPGLRLENIWQGIRENTNLDKTTAPLADESEYDFVPLFGVGAAYEIGPELALYGNWSESYRPKVYADAVPLGTNQVVSGDLDEGEAWQGEAGLRGRLASFLVWDASVFHMEFDRQTGTVGNTIQNVGDAEVDGAELAMDFDLTDWLGQSAERGSVHLFYNLTYLDAVFVAGPSTGLTPQYAPDYTMKAGIEYAIRERFKARLGGTFLDDHFGEDTNNPQRYLSSYKVWDLMLEGKLIGDSVSVFAGINNLFNERYFARVTSVGIDPADGRNYYAGAVLRW